MSLNGILSFLKTSGYYSGYYAVEVTKNLFSEVDTTSQVAGLTSLFLRTLEENGVAKGYRDVIKTADVVRDWSFATKLPGRLYEITSGKAASRDFLGQFNVFKVFSRLCLVVHDFFNSVKFLVQWGGIAKETGTFLAFGLKDTSLTNANFAFNIGGWGADLIDAACRLYEEGPSIEGVITCVQDVMKLAAITTGRFSVVPKFVKAGIDATVLLLGILKAIVKTYNIRLPTTNPDSGNTPVLVTTW